MVKKNRIKEGIASNFLKSDSKKAKARVVLTQAYLNAQEYPSEMWFMKYLLEAGVYNFERNLPCGIYFVDFVFKDKSLAVEVDGKSHFNPEQRYKDKIKDSFLKKKKLTVYRVNAYDDRRAREVVALISNAPCSLWAGLTRPRKILKNGEIEESINSWVETLSKKKKRLFRKLALLHGKQSAREKIETMLKASTLGSSEANAVQLPARPKASDSAVAKEDDRFSPEWLLDLYKDWEKRNARKKPKKKKKEKPPRVEPVIIYKNRVAERN